MRKQIAVRVTRLESFRRYRDEQDWEVAAKMREELVQGIISPAQPNRKMMMGTAFHKILAEPAKFFKRDAVDYLCYTADGFEFDNYTIEMTKNKVDYNGVFEVPMYKTYTVDNTDVIVTGTCDHLLGTVITDFKTRWFEGREWGVFDDNQLRTSYEASFQWRLYLDMFCCDTFKYLIVAMRDREPVELVKIKTDIVCYAYEKMRRDIDDLLYDFLSFVRIEHLEPHVQLTDRERRIIAECEAFA